MLLDTSRNGNGFVYASERCNAKGRGRRGLSTHKVLKQVNRLKQLSVAAPKTLMDVGEAQGRPAAPQRVLL